MSKYLVRTLEILNPETGEVETKDFREIIAKKGIKGGFMMMYKNYDEVLENTINSKKDLKVVHFIRQLFTYKNTEVSLSLSHIAAKTGVSRSKVGVIVKKLTDLNFLKKVRRGVYRMNPFMFLPYKANGEELQREWLELEKEQK